MARQEPNRPWAASPISRALAATLHFSVQESAFSPERHPNLRDLRVRRRPIPEARNSKVPYLAQDGCMQGMGGKSHAGGCLVNPLEGLLRRQGPGLGVVVEVWG